MDDEPPAPRAAVGDNQARADGCVLPLPEQGGYPLARLPTLSKTLFYVRENHPEAVEPRARELLVRSLEAVALADTAVVVERDTATPPRWVTLTVNEQRCTLDIQRVDAPWSLRSKLQEAMRFVQGHLAPAPDVEPAQRLMKIEIAATNGMLSGLDRGSRLLDPDTYRILRPHVRNGPEATKADAGTIPAPDAAKTVAAVTPPMSSAVRRAGTGATVRYLRLWGFPPGISAAVERWLADGESERVKGLVLDLRDNTGGLLNEAVRVADAFIKAGTLGSIASKRETKELVAHDGGHEPGGALVVLVNRRTAEGAELVAAAIKNLGRGVILGEPTAGAGSVMVFFDVPNAPLRRVPSKDVVQDIIDEPKPSTAPLPVPVDDPLGLLLKTGRLLAAGGAEIEKAGVVPDVPTPCAAAETGRSEDDCLVQFADDLVARAQDPSRAAVLSTAKALGGAGYKSRTP